MEPFRLGGTAAGLEAGIYFQKKVSGQYRQAHRLRLMELQPDSFLLMGSLGGAWSIGLTIYEEAARLAPFRLLSYCPSSIDKSRAFP